MNINAHVKYVKKTFWKSDSRCIALNNVKKGRHLQYELRNKKNLFFGSKSRHKIVCLAIITLLLQNYRFLLKISDFLSLNWQPSNCCAKEAIF